MKNIMKKILLLTVFSLFISAMPLTADILYFNDGEELVGTLLSIDKEIIEFDSPNKQSVKIPRNTIANIKISKIRLGDEITNVADMTDDLALKCINLDLADLDPEAEFVTLYNSYEYDFISSSEYEVVNRRLIKIIKESALTLANRNFWINPAYEDFEILFARSYTPSGKIYSLTDDALSRENLYLTRPEYAKLTKEKIALKHVAVGSIIDYSTRRRVKDVSELSPFKFSTVYVNNEPLLRSETIFKFDPDKTPLARVKHNWEGSRLPVYSEYFKDGKMHWKYVYSNKDLLVGEVSMSAYSSVFPTLYVFQEKSWDEIADKVAEAYEKTWPSDDKVEAYLSGIAFDAKDTEYEKIAKICKRLNEEITFVSMSPTDLNSYVPVHGDILFEKKYANMQSFTAVLCRLANKLGIEAYLGFTSSRRNKYTCADLPCISYFTNPVLKLIVDGSPLYTIGGYTTMGISFLPQSMRGSEAVFFDIEKKSHFFETLPERLFESDVNRRLVKVKLDETGKMQVEEASFMKGESEYSFRKLKEATEAELKNTFESYVKVIHPNAVLKNYSYTDFAELYSPMVFVISYEIPGGAEKISDKLMKFKNFWVNYSSKFVSLEERKFPLDMGAGLVNQITVIFELPEGFEWVKWDKSYNHVSENILFGSNLQQKGNTLVFSAEYILKKLEYMPGAEYQELKNCISKQTALANQWLIIEKP